MMDRTKKFRVCEALNHTTLHEHKTTKTFVALVTGLCCTGLCPGTSVKGRDWLETSPWTTASCSWQENATATAQSYATGSHL